MSYQELVSLMLTGYVMAGGKVVVDPVYGLAVCVQDDDCVNRYTFYFGRLNMRTVDRFGTVLVHKTFEGKDKFGHDTWKEACY